MQGDLPGAWRNAKRVSSRARPTRSALGVRDRPRFLELRSRAQGTRILLVKDARFRCEQLVAAFVVQTIRGVYVLVQPVDMKPAVVAKCDCLYDVAIALPGAVGTTAAEHEKIRGVYVRGDGYAGPPTVTTAGRIA